MRQIVYMSDSLTSGDEAELTAIFNQSRHNNAIDGVSGLLCFDGERFLQAFEGPRVSIAATFDRIKADKRHENLIVLIDRPIAKRDFGSWTMLHHRIGEETPFGIKIRQALSNVSEEVALPFLKMSSRSLGY